MTEDRPTLHEVTTGSRWLYVGPAFIEQVEVVVETAVTGDDDLVWLIAETEEGHRVGFWANIHHLRSLVCEMCGGRGTRERRHVGFSHGFLEECDHAKTITN